MYNVKSGSTKTCGACNSSLFPDYKDIKGSLWTRIKIKALERNYCFEITQEEAWNLYIQQNKKCNLSGIPIGFEYSTYKGKDDKKISCTASLDRINNTLGYTKKNCQWLHRDVNMIKGSYDEEYFVNLCKSIAKHKQKEELC